MRIVAEAGKCTERGAIGRLLECEGLSASRLSAWRKQARGALRALGRKRWATGSGPQPEAQSSHRCHPASAQVLLRREAWEAVEVGGDQPEDEAVVECEGGAGFSCAVTGGLAGLWLGRLRSVRFSLGQLISWAEAV